MREPGPPRRRALGCASAHRKHPCRRPAGPPDIVPIRAFKLTRRAVWVHPCRGTGQCMRAEPDKSLQEHQLTRDRLNEDGWYSHRTCIIVPAFNEEDVVGHVVRSIEQALPWADVLVVNDGSRDATAAVAEKAGATVLSLPVNLGLGVRSRPATGTPIDTVLTLPSKSMAMANTTLGKLTSCWARSATAWRTWWWVLVGLGEVTTWHPKRADSACASFRCSSTSAPA